MLTRTFLALFLFISFSSASYSQGIKKTIHVIVKDAATKKTIDGAVVLYLGLLWNKTIVTDAAGQATFQTTLLGTQLTVNLLAKDGKLISGHQSVQKSITLTDKQDYYEVEFELPSSYKMIRVKVSDEKGIIGNAKVTLKGAKDLHDDITNTDETGTAAFSFLLIDKKKTVPVIVEKEGYKTYKSSINVTDKVQEYAIDVTLEQDLSAKVLQVKLLAADNNLPIPEASVTATGYALTDLFTGTSDQSGVANIVMKTTGDYKIFVKHPKFEDAESKVTIEKNSDQQFYPVTLSLKRKNKIDDDDKIDVIIKVVEQVQPGEFRPIPFAMVTLEKANVQADMQGKAVFEKAVTVGDFVNYSATATNYERANRSATIENTTRYTTKAPIEFGITLKRASADTVYITVQVLDDKTQLPVGNAVVNLQALSGDVIAWFRNTDFKGETRHYLRREKINQNPFIRVEASASGYEKRWSELPQSMLVPGNETVFSIFLKNEKPEPGEKMYGPFIVTPGAWHSTGLTLKKGQSFRVKASGIIQYKDPPNTQNTPDGGGYWGWWQLKGKIGEQLIGLGSKGSGTANADGTIELGAPATVKMGHAEEKALEGNYTVYIYSKYAVEDKSGNKSSSKPTASQPEKAKKDLEFIKLLQTGKKVPDLGPKEIAAEAKRIATDYSIPVDWNLCTINIERFHSYYYDRMGQPTESEQKGYYGCLEFISYALEYKINKNQF